jgi:hypothetical protein
MPRKPFIEGRFHLNLSLPETMRAKLDMLLWSPAEGRVPRGAYQAFFIDRINEFFSKVESKDEHSES